MRKILIIDDNTTNLFSLRKILERLELEVVTALSGFEGLELAEKNQFSLVLLDIQMPEMDGFETLERLRKSPKNLHIPVILVSAIFTEDQYKLKGMQTGAVDFIPKPVNPDILRAKVKVFLDLEEHKESLKNLVAELEVNNALLKKEIKKRTKVEAELRVAKAHAEKMNELKSQLLVNMSHEIRTPVNSILGFADLIINAKIAPAEKEKYVRYVSNSSQNLLFLIDEILDHSRMEAGEFKINQAPCDLSEILQELQESFERIKMQMGKEAIALSLIKPKKNIGAETDPQRLRQVLVNLLSNAFKYTKSGSVSFGFTQEGEFLRFFVKDTGIGISEEEASRVFTRFKRVETQDSLQSSGTGLGLSIAERIVYLLGGTIGLNSKLGEGTEFYFTIPFKEIDLTNFQAIDYNAETLDDPDWSKFVLLIAEDEEMNFLFLQEALRASKIQIIWAKNGEEAIKLALDHSPDLILMDVKMPDMNGFQAIEQIRLKNPGLNIIIQTAFAKSDEELKLAEKIYDDLITKPINRNTLIKTMSKFLY